MPAVDFIQDMAIIMLIAGVITILFHRLKQPVVLGYILAGIIIGPHTPPTFIQDPHTVTIFAELGVIFLMFSFGLDFSARKLAKVGISAIIAALTEIVVMMWIGYEIGRFFHWSNVNSLFLGGILAISSTTIIVKVLNELKLQKEKFAQLITGILIIEDILGIGILAFLSGIGTSKGVDPLDIGITLGKLILFLVVSLSVGILIIPRLLAYVAKFKSHEMLLVSVLGLCFGFCLVVLQLKYSIVIAAFLMGVIIAESHQLLTIQKLVEPLRDMFSAVFFVAIGMMLDPKLIIPNALPIIVITLAIIIGKVLACSFGAFITGQNGHTSLRVGMGLAQIGEFSFIIASLGTSLNLTADFLYPIAVSASIITTILTPYLIKSADPLAHTIGKALPKRLVYIFQLYTVWLQSIHPKEDPSILKKVIRFSLISIFINLALIAAIFLCISYFASSGAEKILHITNVSALKTILWGGALTISLPFLVAVYRKIKILSKILAGLGVRRKVAKKYTEHVRTIISELLPVVSMLGIMLFIFALSSTILPSGELLIIILTIAILLSAFLWRWFIKLHDRLKMSFMSTIEKNHD